MQTMLKPRAPFIQSRSSGNSFIIQAKFKLMAKLACAAEFAYDSIPFMLPHRELGGIFSTLIIFQEPAVGQPFLEAFDPFAGGFRLGQLMVES